jgi:hypothetical protein
MGSIFAAKRPKNRRGASQALGCRVAGSKTSLKREFIVRIANVSVIWSYIASFLIAKWI